MKYIIKNESKIADEDVFLALSNIAERGTICFGKFGRIYSQISYFGAMVIYSDVTKNGTHVFTVKDRQIKLKGG